ncbi:MAG TPA: DMT family transporter [Vicinamibacterales bacterium]|nr:DMT family transporter [Vicinamibacterales bacterium]
MRHLRLIDALLFLMSLIWGTNYVIVKRAFEEIDPQAFNAIRMVVASTVFVAAMVVIRMRPSEPPADGSFASVLYTPSRMAKGDVIALAGLGVVGQCLYQLWFVGGLARTSVANAALMLAATPVLIALISAALGEERVMWTHWVGALLSLAGIYTVVGSGVDIGGTTWVGDLMMLGAVCCWAIYTIGSRPLMTRHSPLAVTGISMAIGTALYLAATFPHLRAVAWDRVAAGTWLAIVYSALFALCLSYTIWYAAVREIGSARTSVYSNLVPVVAMVTAALFLHEPMGVRKILGAAAVLVGVALTRVASAFRRKSDPDPDPGNRIPAKIR